ncbi:unnamed protein product [Rotaria magnacalcarata]|uniref:SUEL-type lectin domain-containing protein n=2 Tax=Rotaria magnacalcarata TaxID=392030 RepID=A0A816YWE4_9BILA|nr:unnamed protein product [Rotaria magnacalcarata]CAF3845328.1 unnamed protein product [Rotaria magnacalcarata]CAF5173603.1 unnamed protein product [Rotaria magnacalcarata]
MPQNSSSPDSVTTMTNRTSFLPFGESNSNLNKQGRNKELPKCAMPFIRTIFGTESALLTIGCRRPYTSLNIVSAYYAVTNCGHADVTAKVESYCDSHGTETYCTLIPSNQNMGGDPCPGSAKQFIITYYCI